MKTTHLISAALGAALALTSLAGCTTIDQPVAAVSQQPPAGFDAKLQELAARDNVGAIGVARIIDGKVAWQRYYGERAPGQPAGPDTVFNTASVAKTLIAELTLRLSDKGLLGLDDPIADFYRYPDLAEDPQYRLLTPRILLSHQAGLRNWPYAYDDNKLAFDETPGGGHISYSGAGITILAKYLEQRFDASYPELVQAHVLGPLGVDEVWVSRVKKLDGRLARSVSSSGKMHDPFRRQPDSDIIAVGEWSAADNLFATVPGYAQFLIALIEGRALSEAAEAERTRLLSTGPDVLGYNCVLPADQCPDPLGYGLGWTLFGEPGRMIVNHSGNDFGEHAQVYFSPETGEGLVMFMTGGEAFETGLQIIEMVDPDLRMARHYRALFDDMAANGS